LLKFRRGWLAIPLLVGGVASGIVPGKASAQGAGGDLRLRTARFWRGEGRTLFEGVVGLPVAQSTRTIELVVRDSTGQVLHSETKTDSASAQAAALAALNAETTTQLELLLDPGLYHVTVRRTEGGRTDSATAQVRGFAAAPVISDLVASARMRVLAAGEEPASVEMKRGRFAIERASRVTVQPSDPKLWYYLELYRQEADSMAQLEIRILPAGRDSALVRTTRNVAVGARGTVDAAAMVVQGLPPGDYRMVITARSGNREESREAAFTMASFENTAPVATAGSESGVFDRYFAPNVRPDAEINQIVEALMVAAPGDKVVPAAVPSDVDGKRRFLARYWTRVPDPTPATPRHELVDEYLQRVEYANRNFGESGRAGRSGVKTDRGRIYLKFGAPDMKQALDVSGSQKRVDVWRYSRNRGVKYVFLDESGFSSYILVYSTDPQERTLSDWEERVLDFDTIRAIMQF
jgi:GWxTD domain-containing protein